jgi:hypothetical protein
METHTSLRSRVIPIKFQLIFQLAQRSLFLDESGREYTNYFGFAFNPLLFRPTEFAEKNNIIMLYHKSYKLIT